MGLHPFGFGSGLSNFRLSVCQKIYDSLENNGVIVGFSGGADSVALLHFLCGLRDSLNLRVFAVHVHHGLRGAEADEDVEFCREFCRLLDIGFEVAYVSMLSEAGGRKLRYEALRRVKDERGMDKIALGHNRDDVAETVLLQILRGAGRLRGISGISGDLVRPFIDVSRESILEYCGAHGLEFRQDSSNFSAEFARNKIRLELLPYLAREFNPAVAPALVRLAKVSQAEDEFLDDLAGEALEECFGDGRLDVRLLLGLDLALARRVLRLVLREVYGSLEDIGFEHVEALMGLLQGPSGREISLPGGIVASRVYDEIWFGQALAALNFDREISLEQEIYIDEVGHWFFLGKNLRRDLGKKAFTMALCCGKIKDVRVRTRRPGDKIYFDTVGTKKIKDYFIDKKIPRVEREKAIFAACGSNVICILDSALSNVVVSDYFNPKEDTDCVYLQIWQNN